MLPEMPAPLERDAAPLPLPPSPGLPSPTLGDPFLEPALAAEPDDTAKRNMSAIQDEAIRIARERLKIANAQTNTVSASDVLEGEQALNNARLQLETARKKSRDMRAVVVTPDHAPFVGSLPQGSIELIAIARHPSDGGSWWQMDGTPATEGPFLNRSVKSGTGEGRRAYEFVLRTRDLPEDAAMHWQLPGSFGWGGGSAPSLPSQPEISLPGYELVSATFPEKTRVTNVRAGIATGAWETLKENAPGASAAASFSHAGEEWSVTQASTIESKEGTTLVTYASPTHANWQTRVVAFLENGREVPATRTSALNDQSEWRFENVALESVKQFRFQARRYQWVEFRDVALVPRWEK